MELCGPQVPRVPGLGLPKVLLGLEEIEALVGLSPVKELGWLNSQGPSSLDIPKPRERE